MRKAKMLLGVIAIVAALSLTACVKDNILLATDWGRAFTKENFSNYRVVAAIENNAQKSDLEIQVQGDKAKLTKGGTVSYLSTEDTVRYEYTYENGIWSKQPTQKELFPISSDQLSLKEDSFTLTDGYYVCEGEKFASLFAKVVEDKYSEDQITGALRIKIKDGKLTEAILHAAYPDGTLSINASFSGYGITLVELPLVESDELTEAEWDQAFQEKNFSNYKITKLIFEGGRTSQIDYFVDGDKVKAVYHGDAEETFYLSRENGTIYIFKNTGNGYTKQVASETEWNKLQLSFLQGKRSDFTLRHGLYVCSPDKFPEYIGKVLGVSGGMPAGVTGELKLDMKDRLPAHLSFEVLYGEQSSKQVMTFWDYGKASVTLPDVTGGSGEETNQPDWNAAFAAGNFQNYQVAVRGPVNGETQNWNGYIDGKKMKQVYEAAGEENWILFQAEEDGSVYTYYLRQNGWQKGKDEATAYCAWDGFSFLRRAKDDFIYKDGVFTVKAEKFRDYIYKVLGYDRVAEQGDTGYINLKMENDRLVEISVELTTTRETIRVSIAFSDWSGAVTLPTIGSQEDMSDWDAVFHERNFQNFRADISLTSGSDVTDSQHYVNGNRMRSVYHEPDGDWVEFLSLEGGALYAYVNRTGVWTREPEDTRYFAWDRFESFRNGKDDFTYENGYYVVKPEKLRGYVAALHGVKIEVPQDLTGTIRLKMENDRLAELVMESGWSGGSGTLVFTFSDWGGDVTLPEVGSAQDATDWANAFAEQNFAKYQIAVVGTEGDSAQQYTGFVDNKKMKQVYRLADGDFIQYQSDENGAIYQYFIPEGSQNWMKQDVTDQEYCAWDGFSFLRGAQKDFTYENGYYVVKPEKFVEYYYAMLGYKVQNAPEAAGWIKVKIADGRLSEIAYELIESSGTLRQVITFSEWNGAVTLPQAEEGQVYANWDKFFAQDHFQKFKVTLQSQAGNDSVNVDYYVDGNRMMAVYHEQDGDKIVYYSLENGRVYEYVKRNGVWEKQDATDTTYFAWDRFSFLREGKADFLYTGQGYLCRADKFRDYVFQMHGVKQEVPEDVTGSMTVKADQGKLSEILLEGMQGGQAVRQVFQFSDWDGGVTLPQVGNV